MIRWVLPRLAASLARKSDNGDFGIEGHVDKLDHSLDLAGHRGAYEDELRV